MNNTNNISENTVSENQTNVKIEYVNPLKPDEVLKVKDNSITNIQVEEVNNIEPKEEIKEIEEKTSNENEPVDEVILTKPKRKNKLVIIIVALVALAIILTAILLIPKLFKEEEPKPVIDTPIQEEAKIGLSDIITNSTNNTYYNFLTSKYTVNINNTNDSIIFDLNSIDPNNPISKQIIFNLSNRDLKLTLNPLEDNTDNLNALYAVLDGIGQYYGHEIDEVGNYLNSSNNNFNFNTTGITTTELTTDVVDPITGVITPTPNGQIEISANIDTNYSTAGLNSMYFSLDELNAYKDTITNNSVNLKKGDLILYTNSSDIYTILIGQRKELNDNTYNTINSLIELLYPEEINDFKSKFTSLSTISFDKYKMTVDPILDANTFSEYQNNYKFILIEITKQA